MDKSIHSLALAALFTACVAPVAAAGEASDLRSRSEGLLLAASIHDRRVAPHQAPTTAQPGAPLPPGAVAVAPCSGVGLGPPAALPPAGSPPFIWMIDLCFARQGGVSTVEPETYLYYMQLRPSRPSEGVFLPFDETAEQRALADFQTLMESTGFLDDMLIRVDEHTFPNGSVGVIVTYDMEERERVKIVQYEGTRQIDRTRIEEQLRERGVQIRLDSFLDERTVRRVENVLREMMGEKGYTNAVVSHEVTPVAGGPKLVNIRFNIEDGPRIRIRSIDFEGNEAFGNRALRRQIKENKPGGLLGWLMGGGTYKEAAYEEDAARIEEHYHNAGFAQARVGNPEILVLEDSADGRTRWVELQIPVAEGPRYRIGELDFDGNTLIPAATLRSLYNIEPGEWFSRKKIQEGNRRAQEIYGAFGYMEFTPFPDLRFSDQTAGIAEALQAQVPDLLLAPEPQARLARAEVPSVDVTMRIEEGPQYFVNRITFTGNTTTRDHVIRRELQLVEGGVFDTEALKHSIRRLNQLGYFQPLEGDDRDMVVDKDTDRENTVDITLRLEEQNRNQLTFGAGISQFEGFFGQIAFQTSNFMGRGESMTVSLQAGDRAQNYQLGFTDPFLFDRNMSGGFDIYKRALRYPGYYTQKATGGNLVVGRPVAAFSRMFMTYGYEQVRMADLNEALIDTSCFLRPEGCGTISSVGDLSQFTDEQLEVLRRNPFLYDSLLIGQGGRRTISKIVPTFVHNTVDHPIFPSRGTRYTASVDLAVLGGNTNFLKPRLEGIWYVRHTSRTSIGFRGQMEYISPVGQTTSLPIFERLFLGGEYSVRGYDIRSIGPTVPGSVVVLGGNKSLLFNLEYLITIAGPVRLVAFYDAGQVRDFGQSFGWREDRTQLRFPDPPALIDPFSGQSLVDPNAPGPITEVIGRTSAFKTSTGLELRFFMPVLNVPFRLIYAFNPQREGVLNNNLTPAPDRTFRFAVGTTF